MSLYSKNSQLNILVIFSILILVGSLSLPIAESRNVQILKRKTTIDYPAISCRKHTAVLTEFGGVGDGKTLNTKAFQSAIANLSQHASDGGAQLIVPPGKWLTGSFNLTSHFTLFLQEGAVLLASQNEADFPIIDILPSYGREQNFSDGRYASLIIGMNLTDVVITGNNGTIDGQGAPWWEKYKKGLFKATRPFLIEILHTSQLQISNITLTNSPSWHVHPIYCSNVVIEGVTILAPVEVPNTDGINPDSCTNVRIEDVYIVSGDDCIAIKSGWDQYGIKYGMPTQHLVIRRLTCISPDSATIALGSEMSGGIQDVRAEDITAINTQSAVRIKTAPGRGGYIKDIFVRRMTLKTMKYVFWVSGAYKTHVDNGYDPNALAEINNINYRDIVAENVNITGSLSGFEKDPFTGFCISNATITLSETAKKVQWNCTYIEGVSNNVTPKPCDLLPQKDTRCSFPEDKLPIETVPMKTCSFKKLFL
ncbi:probable polygalacturonase [Hevea brasiliensis]|uniref:probable polygalacturonase n=1 Tax=Hevea brasiliensis TaxID=3981 RepID=UPI0025F91E5D|nr:probable polygalacturonase [Hevea brasiliensis]